MNILVVNLGAENFAKFRKNKLSTRIFKLMIDREMKKKDLLRLMIFANHFETASLLEYQEILSSVLMSKTWILPLSTLTEMVLPILVLPPAILATSTCPATLK